MTLSLSTVGDFATVVDTLETLTHETRGRCESRTIQGAWRFSEVAARAWPSSEAIITTTNQWQLPYEPGVVAPAIGDRLFDAAGRCWVVSKTERLRGETRYRVSASETVMRRDLCDFYRVEVAIWNNSGEEPVIDSWEPLRSGLLAHAELQQAVDGPVAAETVARYRIGYIDDQVLGPGQRLVDSRGTAFLIQQPSEVLSPGGLVVVDAEASVSYI